MRPKYLYLVLSAVGAILPWLVFLPFLREHGANPQTFVEQLFSTPVGGFFGSDVIISSVVLWVFVFFEGRRLGMRRLWVPIVGNLLAGVSLGLPLFLYLRERRRDERRAEHHSLDTRFGPS